MEGYAQIFAPHSTSSRFLESFSAPRHNTATMPDGLRQRRGSAVSSNKIRRTKERELESHDFENLLSPVVEAQLRSRTRWDHTTTNIWRWCLLTFIGVGVALLAVLIISSTRFLQRLKFSIVYGLIDRERAGNLWAGCAFLAFLSLCVAYALVAALPVVFLEPSAAGSGIPEVITVLNGIKMPTTLRLKTLACKVFGIIFAVASGLPCGYEGPMVAIGASVAAGMSQGKSTTLGFDTRWSVFRSFRRDAAKRDFITCGAGAGIASAFNAPIGGVLFALEEGSSHWKKSLAWRCLWATMIGAFCLDFLLSGLEQYINWATGDTEDDATASSSWGVLSGDAMLSLGSFSATGQTSLTWGAWELPLFISLGMVSGVFGAAFNSGNAAISRWRLKRNAAAAAAGAGGGGGGGGKQKSNGGGGASSSSNSSIGGGVRSFLNDTLTRLRAASANSSAGDKSPLMTSSATVTAADIRGIREEADRVEEEERQHRPDTSGITSANAAITPDAKPQSKHLAMAPWRLFEVIGVTTIVSAVAFLVPVLMGSCVPLPPASFAAANRYSGAFVRLYCPSGSFNPLASLWLAPQEEAIRFLLHFTAGNSSSAGGGGNTTAFNTGTFSGGFSNSSGLIDDFGYSLGGGSGNSLDSSASASTKRKQDVVDDRPFWSPSRRISSLMRRLGAREGSARAAKSLRDSTLGEGGEAGSFSPSQLFMFFFAYTLLMCFTSGIALPAGLFIPTLLSGAAIGRLLGEGVNRVNTTPDGTWDVDPGTYALIGAAAMLAGVTRMSVSLAAIILESSGNFSLSLPLALTIMSARAVGNFFNKGIYDTQIHLRQWPVLEKVDDALAYELRACDVMKPSPLVFSEIETVGRIYDVLLTTTHHGFPVVFSEAMARAHPRLGSLAGFVQRRHLAVILAHRAFHAAPPRPLSELTHGGGGGGGSNGLAPLLMLGNGNVAGSPSSDEEAHQYSVGRRGPAGSGDEDGYTALGSKGNRASFLFRFSGGGSKKSSPPARGGSGSAGSDDGAGEESASGSSRHGSFNDVESSGGGAGSAGGSAGSGNGALRGGGGGGFKKPRSRGDVRLMSPVSGGSRISFSEGSSGNGNGRGRPRGVTSPSAAAAGGGAGRGKADIRLCLPAVSSSHELFGLTGATSSGTEAAEDDGTDISRAASATPPPLPGDGVTSGAQPYLPPYPPAYSNYVVASSSSGSQAGVAFPRYQPSAINTGSNSNSNSFTAQPRLAYQTGGGSQQVLDPLGTGAAVISARTGKGVGTFTTVHVRTSSTGSSGGNGPGSKQHGILTAEAATGITSSGSSGANGANGVHMLGNSVSISYTGSAAGNGAGGAGGLTSLLKRVSPTKRTGDSDRDAQSVPLLASAAPTGVYSPPAAGNSGSGGGGGGGDGLYRLREEGAEGTVGVSAGGIGRENSGRSISGSGLPGQAATAALSAELYRALYAQEVVYEEEPLLSYDDLEDSYPRYPDPASMSLTEEEGRMFIDLRPYSDPSPITVHVHAPLSRTFRLFRTLCLRHLLVVNDSHDVVGLITRHDLCAEALHAKAKELGIKY